ncbi:MFS transporter [Streptomyces tubbatahanensis]|uniref:MFS transporter n=1 Tax=Streptomyces tubbatahanensis TaxID=2923272 RepID=A0ABY3XZV1_9ACTN|nr:MFS transporter [Streptomyces tubbatahanensis]UNS99818.1 MFS transporter [Streptomyces tubbatahanensis]
MSHSRVQTSEDEARGVADPHRWWALLVIGLAQLMVVLDATIVNVALPSAQRALGMSDNNRQWVITAYTLAFGGLLLLGGRVADLVGRKRTFIIGLIGFAVASGVGGAAGSSGMLFAARAAQGVFAALLAPSALSLLSTTFTDPKERSKAFGVYGAIAGAGAAIGLLLGGVLTEYLDWRWCLYVNVLFAGLTLLGALRLLHDRPGHEEARLDIPGAVLGCGGLIALVYGVSEAEPRGWDDAVVLGLLCGSALLLVLFVLWQRRARTPLLPLHIVKNRNRAGSFLTMGLATLGMFGVFLFLTYYMQGILGYSPLRTGLAYLPISGAIILGSTQVSARLLPHVPPRLLMAPGMLLAAAGMAVLTQLETDSSYVSHLLPAELLFGFGLGCAFMPVISTATQGVAAHDSGVTSATVNTAQQVGGSIGTALLNTVATSITNTYVHDHLRDPKMRRAVVREGVVHGFTAATWVAMAVMLLGAVLAAVLVTAKPIKPETADAGAPAPGAGSGG